MATSARPTWSRPLAPPHPPLRAPPASGRGLSSWTSEKGGGEKIVAKLLRGPAISQSDFGDPTAAAGSSYALCIYDDLDTLVTSVEATRPGEDCRSKSCWKSLGGDPPDGKGFRYADKDASDSGLRSILLKAGGAGKSSIVFVAGNKAKKNQTALPLGSTMPLAATTSVRVQLVGEQGTCFQTTLSDIKKQDEFFFKAK